MIEKDDSSYSYFSLQDGECSRMSKARRTSYDEVLHKKLDLPSIPGKGNRCKTSPERDVHSKEGMKTFPTSKIDKDIWSMYPCASYGTSNHNMEKCRRRKFVQENSSKKKAKGKAHFSKQRKRGNDKNGSWFQDGNKTLCSDFGKSGHQIEKCWTLYPHLCLKQNQKYVRALARR
jgi:hypothetical protein